MKPTKRPWSFIMLDNVRAGINVDYGIKTTEKEAKALKDIFASIEGCEIAEGQYSIHKNGKNSVSTMCIDLRRERRLKDKEKWYLNFSGNPVNHVYGSNALGFPEADWQIKAIAKQCLDYLGTESKKNIPESLYSKVKEGQIHLNSLEFAAYTKKAGNVKALIGSWQIMFGASRIVDENNVNRFVPLDELLGVNSRVDDVEYPNSFAVSINEAYLSGKETGVAARRYNRNTSGIRVYDKVAEIEFRGSKVRKNKLEVIGDRLRIDLNLPYRWFDRRRIRTLEDLRSYVGKTYAGDWKRFVEVEITRVIDTACLFYMFTFPRKLMLKKEELNQKWRTGIVDLEVEEWAESVGINPRVTYKAHRAMMNGLHSRHIVIQEHLKEQGLCLEDWRAELNTVDKLLNGKPLQLDKSDIYRSN